MDALSTLSEPSVAPAPAPPSPVHADQFGVAEASAEAGAPIPHHKAFAAAVFTVLALVWAGALAGLLVWAL